MTSPGSRPTLLYQFYRGLTSAIAPLAYRKVAAKLQAQGIGVPRQRERLGHASEPRPDGVLIWLHGASVGESQAAMTLVEELGSRLPQAEFLITSGTATSSEIVAKRLPARCRHQFAPLDAGGPVSRFLNHWRPDAAIFVESELWPVTLAETRRSGARLALVNARLSERSVDRWRKKPETAAFVMDQFALFLTQNAQIADHLLALGADPEKVRQGGNLKAGAQPLPVDDALLQTTQSALGPRQLWVASSTHAGEEQTVLTAHKALLRQHPDLCLILVPRHPDRGDAVEHLVSEAGLTCARRSRGDGLDDNTQVYLADTLGEVGTWYALCPIVFLGGSLEPIGGHNPFEVANAGAAVITGPGYHNFAETFPPMITGGGAVEIRDADQLTAAVDRWLTDVRAMQEARDAARAFADQQARQLNGVIDALIAELKLEPGNG